MKRLTLLIVLCLSGWLLAQEERPATNPAAHATAEHATEHSAAGQNHPVVPENATWASSMVIIIVAMFIAAAWIGVVVRLNMPEAPPEPAVHDDHGHDQHGTDSGSHGGHGHGH